MPDAFPKWVKAQDGKSVVVDNATEEDAVCTGWAILTEVHSAGEPGKPAITYEASLPPGGKPGSQKQHAVESVPPKKKR